MDKHSKIIFYVLIVLVVFSILATYYRVFIKEDYLISAEVFCDPQTESCFVGEDEEGNNYNYKIIKKKAALIPFCNPHETECPELSCSEEELGPDCEVIYCEETELGEGEKCSG